MVILRVLILFLLIASPSWAQATWPNKPAGFQTVLDCPFSSMPTWPPSSSGCGISNFYQAGAIVQDGSAPLSPPSAFKSWLSPGANTGGSQLNWVNSGGVSREMYVGFTWRVNSGFFGRQVANKMFFVRGPASNGFFGLMGGPGGGNAAGSPFFLFFGHNSGNVNNGHTCGGDALGLTCFPNVGSGQTVPTGNWFKIEAYLKSSTTNTSRDGAVMWWVNGQPAGRYTNMNLSSAGLNEWVWSETWDGTVNPTPSQEWAHFVDHLHIAVCSGCPVPGGGGGGSTPPPPPPPPLPPLGVGDLRFGS
jgi:hypothetical protein